MTTAPPLRTKLKTSPVLDEQLLEGLPVAVYVCDLNGAIVRYNRKAVELWGRPPGPSDANMLYCGAYRLHLPDGNPLAHDRAPMVEALQAGTSFRNLELEIEQPNGRRLWALLNIDPLRDEHGTIIGAINCFQDVTEHRQAQQRKLRIEELDRSIERQAEFVATVAHELRGPLAPVSHALEIMRRSEPGADTEPLRAMMERQVAHMTRLVEDLIDGSRVTAGKIEFLMSQVDLCNIVEQGAEFTRPAIEAAKQQLVLDMPQHPVCVVADAMRMTQVFGNLLGNATKFTSAAGRINVSLSVEDSFAVVRVSDNGVGIPAEELTTIFDMFSQGRQSPARGSGGLGIGLALTRRIVEMHDGEITAESAGVGRGSRFTFRLPMATTGRQQAV